MLMRYAMEYRDKYGFSVIPLGEDKRPLCNWVEYQKRKPTDEELESWNRDYPKANLGIVTGSISNLAVVDIDEQCGYEAIKKYIPDELKRPTVRTRKGTHYYFRHAEGLRNNARVITGCDLRAEGGYVVAPPSTIDGHQYKFIEKLSQIPIPLIPQAYVDAVTYKRSSATVQVTGEMFAKGRRDEDLFHIAHQLVKAETDESAIRQVLYILGKHCGFSQNDIEMKIVSAIKRKDFKEGNLKEMVRSFIDDACGIFSIPEIYHALHIQDAQQKEAIRKLIRRWSDKNETIIKVDGQNGRYRKIDNDLDIIELEEFETDDSIDLPLPLGLNSLVKIMPKNIIVVAGSPNAGKTAFMLTFLRSWIYSHFHAQPRNVPKCPTLSHYVPLHVPPDVPLGQEKGGKTVAVNPEMSHFVPLSGDTINSIYNIGFKTLYKNKNLINQNQMQNLKPLDYTNPLNQKKLRYITSEMSAQELSMKISDLGIPREIVRKCVTFVDRGGNFADAIEPNSINIIDYLELTDNFYMVSGMLKDIHHKLENGICLVAIQKEAKSKDPRGGLFAKEKPRLVINLDCINREHGKAEITKAKIWKDVTMNPNHLQCQYVFKDKGSSIELSSEWSAYANEGI